MTKTTGHGSPELDPDFTDKIRARAQLNERLSRIEAKLDRVIEMLAKYNSFMLQLEGKK